MASHNADSLVVLDVSTPASPTIVASLTDSTNLDGAHNIVLDGSYSGKSLALFLS